MQSLLCYGGVDDGSPSSFLKFSIETFLTANHGVGRAMTMKSRAELDYDFFKSMFIIYLTATITLAIGSLNAFSRDMQAIGYAMVVLSFFALFGVLFYFVKFHHAYKNVRAELEG
jgi:hypothetical protein